MNTWKFLISALFLAFLLSCEKADIKEGTTQPPRSPSEVVANITSLAGQTVTIVGKASKKNLSCTAKNCLPENPCCNTCGGFITLINEDNPDTPPMSNIISLMPSNDSGATYLCSGGGIEDYCDIECDTFEAGKIYEVTGTIYSPQEIDDENRYFMTGDCYLKVQSFTEKTEKK